MRKNYRVRGLIKREQFGGLKYGNHFLTVGCYRKHLEVQGIHVRKLNLGKRLSGSMPGENQPMRA